MVWFPCMRKNISVKIKGKAKSRIQTIVGISKATCHSEFHTETQKWWLCLAISLAYSGRQGGGWADPGRQERWLAGR